MVLSGKRERVVHTYKIFLTKQREMKTYTVSSKCIERAEFSAVELGFHREGTRETKMKVNSNLGEFKIWNFIL